MLRTWRLFMVAAAFAPAIAIAATAAEAAVGIPPAVTARAVQSTAGQQLSDAVATINVPCTAASFSATIDWGDGQTSPATFAADAGNASLCDVVGAHTFAAPGTYATTITVAGILPSAHGTATVSAVPAAAPSAPVTPAPRSCDAPPSAAAPPFAATGASPNRRYLQGLYHDLLGRPALRSELATFARALDSGATRAQIVSAITSSGEYRAGLVSSSYQRFLGRSVDPGAAAVLIGLLETGGTDEQLLAQIAGSAEYFHNRGGATNVGFVDALHCDALGRHADAAALQAFGSALDHGLTRAQVAGSMLSSSEYRQDMVRGWYLRFLRRSAGAAELNAIIGVLDLGQRDEQALAGLLASQEYFNRFNPGAGLIVIRKAGGLLRIGLAGGGTLDMKVFRLRKQSAHRVGVVHLGHHGSGVVSLHWDGKVAGRTLQTGRYMLVLRVHDGTKLTGVGDAVPFRVP